MDYWRHWKYKNITFVLLGLIIAVYLSQVEWLYTFILNMGNFGYLGAFVAGMLIVSTFTMATGFVMLLLLAKQFNPLEIGLIAGLGAVAGDLTIFRFVKNNLLSEIESIYNHIDNKHHLVKIFHTKYFHWSLPVIGALIIASPLPDELGVTLMGISKMKTYKFMIVSFLLNTLGILIVISSSRVI